VLIHTFAAASAALVRSDVARRSSSATIAMMLTVSRLAFGISAAVNAMPDRCSPSRKCASRAAIELCDDQSRLPHTTFGQRSPKLWTTISLATLDLDEFRERRRAEAGQVGGEGARCASMPRPERLCLSVETQK
jgi:hypothetical protein